MQTRPKNPLRDIAIVAGYELAEALRTRRILILVILFVGGATFGSLAFVEVLENVEKGLAQTLAIAGPGKAGAVTTELMRSPEFERVLSGLLDDEGLAKELISLPPLALFYGWLGLTFMPTLIMLSAAETISSELAGGALRFSLLRTSRLNFSVGKLVGQTLLMLVGLGVGALAVWLTGYFSLSGFAAGATGLWLALLSVRIAVYAFAHVGLAVGLSHMTRSVPVSRALALGTLMLFSVLHGIGVHSDYVREHAGAVVDTLLPLFPNSHELGLWQADFVDRLPALVMLGVLGVGYFALGYAYRARRDV
jgi:ABC-type transport system involved in multi-copper enzyme maturation permease subunit